MRTLGYSTVSAILLPAILAAQTTLPVPRVSAHSAGNSLLAGQVPFEDLTAPVSLLPAGRESGALTGENLDVPQSRSEQLGDRAFLNVAPHTGSGRIGLRGKVGLIALSLAVHAAVTWDAQSTNHFFHHCPPGYRPAEMDPLMRPFAGKALMYPMANLVFAAPNDLLLFKTRHSRLPIRLLNYAAASFWTGVEIHQSIINMENEHIKSK